MIGEPDAGKPPVRFDEGVQETYGNATRLRPTLRPFPPSQIFFHHPPGLTFAVKIITATRKPGPPCIFGVRRPQANSRPDHGPETELAHPDLPWKARLRPTGTMPALRLPGTPEAYIVVPVRRLVPVTVRDADVLWIVVPGPAPHYGRVPLPSV